MPKRKQSKMPGILSMATEVLTTGQMKRGLIISAGLIALGCALFAAWFAWGGDAFERQARTHGAEIMDLNILLDEDKELSARVDAWNRANETNALGIDPRKPEGESRKFNER